MNGIPRPPTSFYVAPDKVTQYLLNPLHPRGGSKARFFLAWGFSPAEPHWLAFALIEHAKTCRVAAVVPTAYGHHFVYEGQMSSPKGAPDKLLRTVWEVVPDSSRAKFISAFPF